MHQSCKNVTKMRVHVQQLLPSATAVAERLCFHKRLSFCPRWAGGMHGRGECMADGVCVCGGACVEGGGVAGGKGGGHA